MYVAWYGYNAPLGVSRKVHVLAIASATWLTAFFAYYMAAEAPLRPQYHTVPDTHVVLCGSLDLRNPLL